MAHKHETLITEGSSVDMPTIGTNLHPVLESSTTEFFFTATDAAVFESTATEFFTATEASCSNTKDSTSTSEYYSPRIQTIKERMKRSGITKVKTEIEASKDHWTELPSSTSDSTSSESSLHIDDEAEAQAILEANEQLFESLQKEPWGRFFVRMGDWRDLGDKLAEGEQAEIFQEVDTMLGLTFPDSKVFKVFKKGTALQDLLKQIPPGMLQRHIVRNDEVLQVWPVHCSDVNHAVLLKDGRLAFNMRAYSRDLRNFIDQIKMLHNCNNGLPFTDYLATDCVLQIAMGMQGLHADNILHRGLKASNVLVHDTFSGDVSVHLREIPFICCVADFECSVGVVGTGFWRAPEILLGLKNRDIRPELFTEKSDVYSYALTCYEVLTGLVPFELEGYCQNDYDVVLRGKTPKLPRDIKPWIKELLRTCWHQEPSKRPIFVEIVGIMQKMNPSSKDNLCMYKYI